MYDNKKIKREKSFQNRGITSGVPEIMPQN